MTKEPKNRIFSFTVPITFVKLIKFLETSFNTSEQIRQILTDYLEGHLIDQRDLDVQIKKSKLAQTNLAIWLQLKQLGFSWKNAQDVIMGKASIAQPSLLTDETNPDPAPEPGPAARIQTPDRYVPPPGYILVPDPAPDIKTRTVYKAIQEPEELG